MGFLYPGLNVELRYCLEDPYRKDVYLNQNKRDESAWKFYPIDPSKGRYSSTSPILQMREVAMMMFMEKITDKERWNEKVLDQDIVAKWKQEAMEMPERGLYDRIMWEKHTHKIPFHEDARFMSEAAFDFCIAELRDKARHFQKTDLIPALDSEANAVIKSDTLIPKPLQGELVQAFKTLMADQKENEDWHPGSNQMQLNLVHPSMYPLVWGRSTYFQDEIVGTQDAVTHAGKGQVTPKHESVPNDTTKPYDQRRPKVYDGSSHDLSPELWSPNYQWLPSIVSFWEDGKPKFTSYINNLDPNRYPEIYETLERFVDIVIPAWDQCLQEHESMGGPWDKGVCGRAGRQQARFERITSASDSDEGRWVPFDLEYWKRSDAKLTARDLMYLSETCLREQNGWDARLSMEERDEFCRCEETGETPPTPHVSEEALAEEKWQRYRTPIYPEPLRYTAVDYTPTRSIREMFKDEGLQIIVKMASIELTPEKPEFPGGSWHIEGQMNERICATALYYVDSDNVTTSKLAFRVSTDGSWGYDLDVGQDEYNWLEKVHGVSLGHSGGLPDSCLQTYGDVETRQGRVLAFPNVFQHRVSPFELKDKSKPGHRRFIALWLIDPHQRIVSTANVPPQQRHWLQEYLKDSPDDLLKERIDSLITKEEAEEHRKKLMEERTSVGEMHEAMWTGPEYNFCEH